MFLQEGAPSTWAWALPRPDSPIPRHKLRGLWQPPDRESGSQVSLHLPLHSGLPLNLPPSPFLGWEQSHLISDWPPTSAQRCSWSSQHRLIFLCLFILENTRGSPILLNAIFFFFFACCATSQVKPRRQMHCNLMKSHHSSQHNLEIIRRPTVKTVSQAHPQREPRLSALFSDLVWSDHSFLRCSLTQRERPASVQVRPHGCRFPGTATAAPWSF